MNFLGIDSTRTTLLIVVVKNGEVFYAESAAQAKHNSEIIPKISEALEKAGLDISDIDCFSAVSGPGSFTGIRVGICTANGFAYALQKKLIAVNSFEIMLEGTKKTKALIPALKNNYFYAEKADMPNNFGSQPLPHGEVLQQFSSNKNLNQPSRKEASAPQHELGEALEHQQAATPPSTQPYPFKMGYLEGFDRASFASADTNQNMRFSAEDTIFQDEILDFAGKYAALLQRKASSNDFSETLVPLYLRASQAERMYDEKEKAK